MAAQARRTARLILASIYPVPLEIGRALDVLAPSARPQPRAFSPQLSYEILLSYLVKKVGCGRAKHRVMEPVEIFLARIAALVPPPRFPLVRFAGVLAPRSKWRHLVVPRPPKASTAASQRARCVDDAGKPEPVVIPDRLVATSDRPSSVMPTRDTAPPPAVFGRPLRRGGPARGAGRRLRTGQHLEDSRKPRPTSSSTARRLNHVASLLAR